VVSFGGIPASSFTVISPTSIYATLTSGASGSVSVTTPAGTGTLDGFHYVPTPIIRANGSTSLAYGESVLLICSAGKEFNYQWFKDGVAISVATDSTYTATQQGFYNVVITLNKVSEKSALIEVTSNSNSIPTITSFDPPTAIPGTTITLTGTNFTGTTAVNFGETPAVSFLVISPTSITAVVGQGTSGKISVTSPGGTSSLSGFTFVPAPTITSFTGCSHDVITINGANFTNATSVSFGGVPAKSFEILSSSVIKAIVGTGASGNIEVITPGGKVSLDGFVYLEKPTISAGGSTTFSTGGSVVLKATGFASSYKWFKGGKEIIGAEGSRYTATESGSYTVMNSSSSCEIFSEAISINAVFTLPTNNFRIVATGESCKTSNDGSISITASNALLYTVILSGKSTPYTFTNSLNISDLPAATYSVCITLLNQPDYNQCFEVRVTEPADLSVFSTVDQSNNINLQLDGGASYNVELNGKTYTTSENQFTLALSPGQNSLKVVTDKICQGTVEKLITVSEAVVVYPNPFENVINLNLFDKSIHSAEIEVRNLEGKMVHMKKYSITNGTVSVDLSNLPSGLYLLKVSADNLESIVKILKK